MAAYTMRNIDDGLWQAVHARAKAEGRSVKGVLLLLLRIYAQVGLTTLEAAAAPAPLRAPLRRAVAEVQP